MRRDTHGRVRLRTIAREWGRIGAIGFGGPPTHIALLRKLCVEQRAWLTAGEFEDAIASTNLLPGPASTQLAIFCAWRLRGPIGAILGGICFILPGLVVILGLSALFLAADPPRWVLGAAAGAGATVPVVAVHAGVGLMPASWRRAGERRANRARWLLYLVAGAAAAATVGARLVVVLIVCGAIEVIVRTRSGPGAPRRSAVLLAPLGTSSVAVGGLTALAWVAFKVGALSYGGGFVIIPLRQHDAVVAYHWLTGSQFLNAVALGQITPGPVVQTVAVVGYAAAGLGGGLLAALIAFTPSFVFVLAGGRHFSRLRSSPGVQAFLSGAGPASIGAITGAAIPLGLELNHVWQLAIL
ncbi:MAG: chromate efflux transporter, partial [Actinomycetota bacterium]